LASRRFRFRLASVQRVRMLQEERARAELLLANRALAEAAAELAARKDRYWQGARPLGQYAITDYRPAWFELEMAARGVQWSTAQRIVRAEEAEVARAAWIAAKQRVQALERLEARAREEWRVEVLRDDDRLVDDLVVSRSFRARAAKETV
jgi:flagellar biosynthesis chaperone FliJ